MNCRRKAQITIFAIIAVVLLGAIILFFVFRKEIIPAKTEVNIEENPSSFFEACLEKDLKSAVNILSLQGGNLNPNLSINFQFEGEDVNNISFLCYTKSSYFPCTNQEPILVKHIEEEITKNITKVTEKCFQQIKEELEAKDYAVEGNFEKITIQLSPGKIIGKVIGTILLTKSDQTKKQEDFYFALSSKFYDLVIVAQEIIAQEARFCNFDSTGFMLLYPDYSIEKFRTSSLNTIYTLKHRTSNEMFRFAVRSCVIPPGI